jgi:hypothetical protein
VIDLNRLLEPELLRALEAILTAVAAVAAVISAIVSRLNRKKVNETAQKVSEIKLIINGRLDQLLASAHAAGRAQERDEHVAVAHQLKVATAEIADKLRDSTAEIARELAAKK